MGRGLQFAEYQRETRIRTVVCDICDAQPGVQCLDTTGWTRHQGTKAYASHYGRYKKWETITMHESVMAWVPTVLGQREISNKRVLEVGSFNVNGSVREYLSTLGPKQYVGVDVAEGPGVDRVISAEALVATLLEPAFDVVISTEMLEHAQNWAVCIAEMAEMTKAGGLLVLTTRSPGFHYHPYPVDLWRFTVAGMARVLTDMGLLEVSVVPDPQVPGVFAVAKRPPLEQPWAAPWADRSNTAAAKDLFDPGLYEVTPVQPR